VKAVIYTAFTVLSEVPNIDFLGFLYTDLEYTQIELAQFRASNQMMDNLELYAI